MVFDMSSTHSADLHPDFQPGGAIDLRSDTVTLPGDEMRRAMLSAELGDDVIDIDPTVQRLQHVIAERVGQEAAIFMPSGTMTNQVALRLHCQPGDEFLCEQRCHIFNFEQGAFAQLSGLVARTVSTESSILKLSDVESLIRPPSEHMTRTRLLCLENTHNLGGGRIHPLESVQELCQWAKSQGLASHLDGARLFNAVVATGIEADQWGSPFDTVSVCFSKGLGAPVGSALCGPRDLIEKARFHRKLFGGAMRQSGILAAAALYALEHQVDRLAVDHEVAQILAEGIRGCEALRLDPATVETNIVIFKVDAAWGTASEFVEALSARGVRMMPFSSTHVRAVTHLHVDAVMAQRAVKAIVEVANA